MYNPTYERNKRGTFVNKNSFASIFAGTDAYFIEDELNELQWIQNESRASLIRKLMRSGFHSKGAVEANLTSLLNGFIVGKSEAMIHGYEVIMVNNKKRNDEKNSVILSAPPTTGTRKDLVFLEMWFAGVNNTDTIYEYGGVESNTLPNTILDPRLGVETSRRVQLKWRIRTVDGVTVLANENGMLDNSKVFARAEKTTNTTLNFSKSTSDDKLYIAGTGSDADKISLGSIDGYSYAIPMFIVDRLNSTTYNASTNANGAPTWSNGTSTSPRPDGKFSNVVYLDQIKDFRHQSESKVLKEFSSSGDDSSLTFGKSIVVDGNLTVNGTTTTINTSELNISDNIIRLNNDFTGTTPTENAGIEIERGGAVNTAIVWDETIDKWTATNNGSNYYQLLLSDQKATANGLASLGSDGKVPYAQLPAFAKGSTFIVSSDPNTSDFGTIQAAINAMPVTGGTIQVREGTYNERLTLKSNIVIMGQGYGTVIKLANAANADNLLSIENSNNVKIGNLRLDVNKAGQTSGKNIGVSIYNSSYIDIEDIYIENAKEQGIYLDTVYLSSIRKNAFKNVTGSGIYNFGDPVSDKDGNEIESNKFENCGTAIELDVNSSYNLVVNNLMRTCASGIINSGNDNSVANNLKR